MDTYQQFLRKVIIPFGVQEFLKPKQLEHGEIKYGLISILEENIDSCYNNISYKFQQELIKYIKDFLIELNIRIRNKKKKVKSIKKLISKTENIDEDKAHHLTWELQCEEYIYSYKLEQSDFLKKWITKKEDSINIIKTKKDKVLNWHPLVIPIVNGEINRIHQNFGDRIEATELSAIIIEKLNLNTEISKIRPYVQSSFTSKIDDRKNLFRIEKVKKIITYCKEREIEITDEYFIKKMENYNLIMN